MKKYTLLFFAFLFILPLHPQALNNDIFIGEWEAHVGNYKITLELLPENLCYITVKTYRRRVEYVETTQGTYSFDDNILRINGIFFNSKIEHLDSIEWKSLYQFNNANKSSFSILLPDINDESKILRAIFSRIILYES